jgi:hypothetical protein
VTPPQGDVEELLVHLGCTDEVSSFECLLRNWDKKYSPGGTYPITVGSDGSISLGRGANCPQVLTLTVEEIKALSDALGEKHLRVLGRCWGEKLFRRLVTKTYENQKGEAIVKDLIDNYVGLDHVGVPGSPTEQIVNGSWEGDWTGWTKYGVVGQPQISTEHVHSGAKAVKFPNVGNVMWVKQMLSTPVPKSAVQEFYVWCYAYGGQYCATYIIHDGGQEHDYGFAMNPQGTWRKNDILYYMNVFGWPITNIEGIKFGSNWQAEFYIDDCSLMVAIPTDLIEDTDTTYTKLDYENTPVFDIIKFIAKTADKAGVIGYDFRVRPDGKFMFFPKNTKTCSVSLSERLEVSEYRKSIFTKRDKIYVYGAAEKKGPLDGDSYTETLDINGDEIDDWLSATGSGSVSLDNAVKAVGSYSIKHTTNVSDYFGMLRLVFPFVLRPDCDDWPSLVFQIRRESAFSGQAAVMLKDDNARTIWREFQVQADKWVLQKFNVGKKYANEWQGSDVSTFNWKSISEILWEMDFSGTGTGCFWVDNFFFNTKRWSATYGSGSREYAETDEELHSDNECLLRAKALHDNLSNPAEYIRVASDIVDYGTTPILAGDKILITLPNENIDGYYRALSAEYRLIAETQTLETTLELGKEPPLLADYLYALKVKTANVARYKIARA